MDEAPGTRIKLSAGFIRFHAALMPAEIGAGFLDGWIEPTELVSLAWMRSADLGHSHRALCDLAHVPLGPHDQMRQLCERLAAEGADRQVWRYLAATYLLQDPQPRDRVIAELAMLLAEHGETGAMVEDVVDLAREVRAVGRQQYLLDRAANGQGMKWDDTCALMGTDRPEEVDAAFDRGEPLVGVAVIGLALNHPDPHAILPRVARAMSHHSNEILAQGIVALAHTVRLHQTVDAVTLRLLRDRPRGSAADDDLWTFVPRRRLPWWLWRHHLPSMLRWWLWQRWLWHWRSP